MGETVVWLLAAAVVIELVMLMVCYSSNKELKEAKKKSDEIIAVKDKTIDNLQASRVAVKDVIENFSMHGDVMKLVEEGKTVAQVSEALGIPESKVLLIIKFDRIKKEHAPS